MDNDIDFSTPGDVLKIVETLENAGRLRAQDRALIHSQFNGSAPYTAQEVEEHQINFNVNKLGGYRIALDATQQVDSALLSKDKFFTVRCLKGPEEKRADWALKFADHIHCPMKEGKSGKKHLYVMKNRNTSLVMEGIGALLWMYPDRWMPKFASLEELLIPSDTTLDLEDELSHFGVNSYLTPWQLYDLTHGEGVQKGWDIPFVDKILTSIPKATQFVPELLNRPEEYESMWKQHSGYMNSDAVPKVKLTFFFYQQTKSGKWHRKILFRKTEGINVPSEEGHKFLYDGKDTPFANDVGNILHIQFGAGNVVAPLKFHSIRGLGMLLYSVVEADNRLYCQMLQHVFEALMAVLRVENPVGQDRPKLIQIEPYAVLPQGVTFVPPQERQQINPQLLEMGLAQNKQLLSESSASYVQDVDTGTKKEQTLGEAQIKLQSANKIVGAMLSNVYWQETYYYEEIVRRFLMKDPKDKDVVYFREKCKADGIPDEIMEPRCWKVEVERVFGMGDQTLAVQEVNALMAIVMQLDPSSQIIVRRLYISVITRNPDLAKALVPDDNDAPTEGRQVAEDVFGTLMQSIPVSMREGIEQQDYIIAMAEMMAAKIEQIKATPEQMGKPEDVSGLVTVSKNIEQHLELLSQNPAMKELVNGMTKQLAAMMNEVKAFAERQQQAAEAAAKKEQENPEAMAKVAAMQAQAQAKIEAQAATTQQKLQAEAQKHAQELQQAQEKHAQEMAAMSAKMTAEVSALHSKTSSEMAALRAKTEADIASLEAKSNAQVAATKKAAAAKPAPAKPTPGKK